VSQFRSKRDKKQQLFSFGEALDEDDSDDPYDTIKNQLYTSFKKQVSGFDYSDMSKMAHHSTLIDKYANDISSKGHKLLIKPDAYNVSVLLKPTMAFLHRSKEVFPN
jgi:exocyst complex component 4